MHEPHNQQQEKDECLSLLYMRRYTASKNITQACISHTTSTREKYSSSPDVCDEILTHTDSKNYHTNMHEYHVKESLEPFLCDETLLLLLLLTTAGLLPALLLSFTPTPAPWMLPVRCARCDWSIGAVSVRRIPSSSLVLLSVCLTVPVDDTPGS